MHNATVSDVTNRRAWKLVPRPLALALAAVVVGLGIVATIGCGSPAVTDGRHLHEARASVSAANPASGSRPAYRNEQRRT